MFRRQRGSLFVARVRLLREERRLHAEIEYRVGAVGQIDLSSTKVRTVVVCDVGERITPGQGLLAEPHSDAVDGDDDGSPDGLYDGVSGGLVLSLQLSAPHYDTVRPGGEKTDTLEGVLKSLTKLRVILRSLDVPRKGLNCQDGLQDDGGTAGQHLEGLLGDDVLEIFQGELDILYQTVGGLGSTEMSRH